MTQRRGAPGEALRLVLLLEQGNWNSLFRSGLKPDVLGTAFRQAVPWTSELSRSLNA